MDDTHKKTTPRSQISIDRETHALLTKIQREEAVKRNMTLSLTAFTVEVIRLGLKHLP